MRRRLNFIPLTAAAVMLAIMVCAYFAGAQTGPGYPGGPASIVGSVTAQVATPLPVSASSPIPVSASSSLPVAVASPLPAGSANIGGLELFDSGGTNKASIDSSGNQDVGIRNGTSQAPVDATKGLTVNPYCGLAPCTTQPTTVSGTGSSAASVTVTAAGVSAKTNYLWHIDVSCLAASSGTPTGAITVTGLSGGTLTYEAQQETTFGYLLSVDFPTVPASGTNTSIVLTVPAMTNGGACAANLVYTNE